MDTARFMKDTRTKLNLKQWEFAEMLNVSRSTIACYETNRATPSGKIVLFIIDMLYPKLLNLKKTKPTCSGFSPEQSNHT